MKFELPFGGKKTPEGTPATRSEIYSHLEELFGSKPKAHTEVADESSEETAE